jgi:hypothetical protein
MNNPRPPKKWFNDMRSRMKKEYPRRSDESITRITAGIWWQYPEATRERLIKEYDTKNPKAEMLECPFCHEKNPISRAGVYLKCKCGKNLVSVKIKKKKV